MALKYVVTNKRYDNICDAVKQLGEKHFASEAHVIGERNEYPLDAPVWNLYGWTRGMRLIPLGDKDYLLARDSILLAPEIAQQAVEANEKGELFYPGEQVYEEHYEIAKADKDKFPERQRVMLLPSQETFTISDSEDKTLRFLAQGRKAGKTFFAKIESLGKSGITFCLHGAEWVKQNAKSIFLEQSWFSYPQNGSEIMCGYRYLTIDDRAFGVFPAAEVGARKISETKAKIYTPSLAKVYRFTKPHILPKDRPGFKKGLERLWKK